MRGWKVLVPGPLLFLAYINDLQDSSRSSNARLFTDDSLIYLKVNEPVKKEPPHDKTNKVACAPSEDSDQSGHPPSLIRVFAIRMKKAWVLSYPLSTQRRLWSDGVAALADLSLRWAHSHFVGFVMRRLKIQLQEDIAALTEWEPQEKHLQMLCHAHYIRQKEEALPFNLYTP